MLKKLPYGQSDFAKIIGQNYAYVDKTRYIELLENENNTYQFLIRPRRFGKSLFLSVLESYYDMNVKDRFESLFGDLYIGKNPTPECGTYAVMKFDFSGLTATGNEEIGKKLSDNVQECIIKFFEKYKDVFPDAEKNIKYIEENKRGIQALNIVYSAAERANIPLFVIIDEYDHFANSLIAMGKSYYDEVRAGSTVRSFYETLKKGTSSAVKRIFITGITPMMANDLTSGFNIATDYSLIPKYNEIFGFTREEVRWLMAETGVDERLIKIDMEAYYNGYMFNRKGKDKVYNAQMVLYLFNEILLLGEQPNQIIDDNLKIDYGRLRRLVESESGKEKMLKIIMDGKITANIAGRFSASDLGNEEYFTSLLFYLGMLTVGGTDLGMTVLTIPNYSIRTLYWEYIQNYIMDQQEERESASISKLTDTVREMARTGDIKPYLDYFSESVLKRLSNRDLQKFDEKYIKGMMLATLFVNGLYLPTSEYENENGYADIYLQRHPANDEIRYEHVFEVKYAKTGATETEIAAKMAEAEAQIEKYKADKRFAGRDDVKFAALVFKGKGEVHFF